jgi:hypothetical protein
MTATTVNLDIGNFSKRTILTGAGSSLAAIEDRGG